MNNRRWRLIAVALIACLITAVGFVWYQTSRHARIDEWSSSLTANKIDWAEASSGYGIEKKSHSFTDEERVTLAELLQDVTEENCTRKTHENSERIDYRLALSYEGKLWLFHCMSNGMVRIVFEDPETAAYYGCEDSKLYADTPELCSYILETVDLKAE